MAKIALFRYYGDGNVYNYSSRTDKADDLPSKDNLTSGSLFTDYYTITLLGIQSLPGTKLYINNCDYPMIIGSTGILDLELDTTVKIQSLAFAAESLDRIDATSGSCLLIDIIYEGSAT